VNALEWFGIHLQGIATFVAAPAVTLAPDPWTLKTFGYKTLPPLATVKTKTVKVNWTFGARGKATITLTLPKRKLETFGAPVVTVTATTRTKAPQLVGIIEALTPGRRPTLVSEGGTKLPARKSFTTSFRLISDATLIRKGAKLRLTLGWTTPDLIYLTGVPDGSSLSVKRVYVTLPVLKNPVSG
jgi:hypothetical protein